MSWYSNFTSKRSPFSKPYLRQAKGGCNSTLVDALIMRENARAFVFVKSAPRKEKEIAEKLLTFDEVKETHIITGKWDVLAVIEMRREMIGGSQRKILNFIMEKVEGIKGVQDTSTIIPEFSTTKFH